MRLNQFAMPTWAAESPRPDLSTNIDGDLCESRQKNKKKKKKKRRN